MTDLETTEAEIAQTEHIGLGDLAIALGLAIVVAALQWCWEFPAMHPSVWADATVALGLRPASHVLHGYWIAIAKLVYSCFGIAAGENILRIAGHLALSGIAVVVFALLREILAFVMLTRPQFSDRRTLVMRLAAAIGSLACVMAPPVWATGQFLCETTIQLSLTFAALEFYFVFQRKGYIRYAYVCAALLGLLAAETPVGLLLPVVLIALYVFVIKVVPGLESPLFKPAVMEVGKWHMTFLYFSAMATGITLNCWVFATSRGLGALGETAGYLPLAYVQGYWELIVNAASPIAWPIWVGVCLIPFAVAHIRLSNAADSGRFLPYATGMVFCFCGVLAISQSAMLPALWFWTYFPIKSTYLLTIGNFLCAATLGASVMVLGVDAFCRDHQLLAKRLFGVEDDDEEIGRYRSRSTTIVRRAGMIVIPTLLVGLIVPGAVNTTVRNALAVVADAVIEIVREAGNARFMFTDGNLDTAIEIESARRGGELKCFSLMGGTDALSVYLRTRGIVDSEDLFAFRYDTGMGLRTWIRDKPERLGNVAVQMGFDLWKRDGKSIPPMGGLVSRPTGFPSEEERQRGIEAAHRLIDRVFDTLRCRGGIRACTDAMVKDAFLNVMWRLSRMCKYRGEAYDLAGDAEGANAEVKRASALNSANERYQQVVKAIEKRNDVLLQKLTPREGLQLALVRADFTMGKAYAETIIEVDPENPDANFAMGMYYLKEKQLTRAESYLKRCTIRRPDEPAVYNNLAMIQITLKKFDAAEMNVRRALKLLPESSAVQATKKALDEARVKAK